MAISLKGCYPFRLGTTSFIYPSDYVTNVRRLAPLVDEIELLLFESRHLPPIEEIKLLGKLAKEQNISFNVHLPMDVDLAGDTAKIRDRSIAAVARAIDRVSALAPTTHTLHLDFKQPRRDRTEVVRWQELAVESITDLLAMSGLDPREISIETLDYNPMWLKPIAEMLDLAICVDVGHVILYGFDLEQVFDSFAARTTMMHLHGVASGKDHLALTHLDPSQRSTIAGYLRDFKGSVSIEVFNLKRLSESLDYFPSVLDCTRMEATLFQPANKLGP